MTTDKLFNEMFIYDRLAGEFGKRPPMGGWCRLLDRLRRKWAKTVWLLPWALIDFHGICQLQCQWKFILPYPTAGGMQKHIRTYQA